MSISKFPWNEFAMKLTFKYRSSSEFMCSSCYSSLNSTDERSIVRFLHNQVLCSLRFFGSLCESNVIGKPTSGVLFIIWFKTENKKFFDEMNARSLLVTHFIGIFLLCTEASCWNSKLRIQKGKTTGWFWLIVEQRLLFMRILLMLSYNKTSKWNILRKSFNEIAPSFFSHSAEVDAFFFSGVCKSRSFYSTLMWMWFWVWVFLGKCREHFNVLNGAVMHRIILISFMFVDNQRKHLKGIGTLQS